MKKYLLLILPLVAAPLIALSASYTVQKGDTVKSIAQDFGVQNSDVSGYRSGDPDLIYEGEELEVNREPELGGPILGAATSTIVQSLIFFDELLPDGSTCSNGQILKKTGTNNWDCAADNSGGAGGSPSGNDTNVQFNEAGVFAGNDNFIYVSSTPAVGIATNGATPSSTLHVIGTFQVTGTSTIGGPIIFGGDTVTDFVGDGLELSSGALIFDCSDVASTGITCSGEDITASLGTDIGVAELQSADFGDWTCNGSACTIDANAIALATDTTGNYVATIADDGQSTITVTNSGSENAAVTLRVVDVVCTDCLGTTEIADSYLLNNGDNGTGDYNFTAGTVTIASSTIGSTASPSSTLHVVGTFQVTEKSTLANVSSTALSVSGSLWTNITGSTQCVRANSVGLLSGTGSDCGAGGGTISTSSAITVDYFPFWTAVTGTLSGTSTILNSAGNIGINTSGATPSTTLHVVGGFQVTATSTLGTAIIFAGDTIDELVGTGLQLSSGDLQTTLGTSVDLASAEITGTLAVGNGGTGATSLTDHGVLIGSGTAAVTPLAVGTNGQLLVGSTGADPVFATANCAANLTCTLGAGTFQIDVDDSFILNTGDVGTGVYDFGGADSFEIPNAAGGTTVNATGEVTVDTTTDTFNFYDGTIERALSSEDCSIYYNFGTSGSQTFKALMTPRAVRATSTVTNVYAVHGTNGDTATFNIYLSSNRSTATSSMRKLFTSYQTVTATTTASSLTVNGSTTINTDDMFIIDVAPASTTDFGVGICKRLDP